MNSKIKSCSLGQVAETICETKKEVMNGMRRLNIPLVIRLTDYRCTMKIRFKGGESM